MGALAATALAVIGLANYSKILSDPYFLRSLGNTLLIVVVAVHLELAAGLGIATARETSTS